MKLSIGRNGHDDRQTRVHFVILYFLDSFSHRVNEIQSAINCQVYGPALGALSNETPLEYNHKSLFANGILALESIDEIDFICVVQSLIIQLESCSL
jgi:hypothetical protein